MTEKLYHWADQMAAKIIAKHKDKHDITVAAGITPSGTVHIGNFREVITVDLIKRALERFGKNVRFIYSWDDYDVFRKVPKNMPGQEMLTTYLRKPIVDVPDPFPCKHDSYALHHEDEFEQSLAGVGIHPYFIYQHKMYRGFKYAESMRNAHEQRKKIAEILNKFRKEPLEENWIPLSIFCKKCNRDETTVESADGYAVTYSCACGYKDTIDLRKDGNIKLPWRVDWPMRWCHEHVIFEPGGKDHSTVGGSYDTAKDIVKLFDWEAPMYLMYDFISIKGKGGKISSSSGDVVTLKDALEIYEPELVRWLFAGTRPGTEFAIAFDLEVIKNYEDFDRCERIYFEELKVENEKDRENQKRIYELSCVGQIPERMPFQPSFRHLTNILLMNEMDIDKTIGYYEHQLKNKDDRERMHRRAVCAKNWIEKHAPDDFRYVINKQVPDNLELTKQQIVALHELAEVLKQKSWEDKDLHEELYIILKNNDLEVKEFFSAAYRVLISKEKGPKLAAFLIEIKDKAIALFEKV